MMLNPILKIIQKNGFGYNYYDKRYNSVPLLKNSFNYGIIEL